MSIPIEQNICGKCDEPIKWGEYNYSMTHFRYSMQSGKGLCQVHQKEQRLIEQPEKLAKFLNTNL